MIQFILLLIFSYLLGSIPTSIIVGKRLKGINIMEHGSRNPGATNAFRCLGWKIGVFVLICDIIKGFIPSFFLGGYSGITSGFLANPVNAGLAFGIMTILGHTFTIFLKFKGGKGVATSLGVFLALAPIPVLIATTIAITLISITRFVSLGSITGAALLPVCVFIFQRNDKSVFYTAVIVGLFVIIKHKANIVRLIKGKELKLKEAKVEKK